MSYVWSPNDEVGNVVPLAATQLHAASRVLAQVGSLLLMDTRPFVTYLQFRAASCWLMLEQTLALLPQPGL